jgi:hypothetical protein
VIVGLNGGLVVAIVVVVATGGGDVLHAVEPEMPLAERPRAVAGVVQGVAERALAERQADARAGAVAGMLDAGADRVAA